MSPIPIRRLIIPALFVGGLFLVVFLRQPDNGLDADEWVVTGPAFGTTFTVKTIAEGDEQEIKAELAALVREEVERVDLAMSNYRADSEIMAFNGHGTDPFPASSSLIAVIEEAQRVSRFSGGAFDITVGPLVDAWGFGPAGATEEPGEERLLELILTTGFEQIAVDRDILIRNSRKRYS